MNSILVLCEGNICRSPMAAAILKEALPGIEVLSAGLGALVGSPAHDSAATLLAARGLDVSDHRGTQVNYQMCLDADLILVMEARQRKLVEALFPETRGRVYRVCEFVGRDVQDPYRQDEAFFRQTLRDIDDGLKEWLTRLSRTEKQP